MKAKNVKLSVLLILITGFTTTTLWAAPKEGQGRGQQKQLQNRPERGMNDPIVRLATQMKELDLSEKQQKELTEIVKAAKTSLAGAVQAQNEAMKEMRQAGMGDDINKEAIMAAANKVGKAMGEVTYLRAKLMSKLRSVLTPEQQAELNKKRRGSSGKAVKEKPERQPKEKKAKDPAKRKNKKKQD